MSKKNKQKINQEFKEAAEQKSEDKREAVTGSGKGSSKSTFIALGIAVVVIAVAAFVLFGGGGSSSFTVAKAEAGVVKVPLAEVNDGLAHFYTYKAGGKNVNYFILRSSDGVIRAAFDACDVCFREKKGYKQVGDLMVCQNCGQQFPSVKINEIRGGCNPAPLERAIQGDYLVLNVNDIAAGATYF